MNIYLLRHGQTNINRDGIFQGDIDRELNEFGKKQAELLGKRIQKYHIDIIYSSDLGRVIETSKIINTYTNTEIILKEELREINMGTWDILSMEERYINNEAYATEWHKHLADLSYPNGECGKDVSKRVMKVIDDIKKRQYKNVAIVTSGGTISILLCEILGLEQYKRFGMQIDNCSISVVNYDIKNNKQIVKCINDTGHLEDLILR
ncbi:histidine phosphatase family protein [Sedimentibacter sp.]|uniref:histidine phosphatase family protein n=1 Tax=Sedimentibacter sp. TaxID=1960295 RepID=UPI0028B19AEF|nr:histidine phosphatase family protein [Sedimentibacter sp.]